MYDVSSRTSFASMDRWFDEAEVNTAPGVALYLVGAKSDKPNRAVSTAEGEALAAARGARFCEVSAKARENVRRPFVEIVDEVVAGGGAAVDGTGGRSAGTVKVGGEGAGGGGGWTGCSC